jgi:GTP-binding protein
MSEHWQQLIGEYLRFRQSLQGIVVLMDCRHSLKDSDFLLLQLACEYDRPGHIILTKADKLKHGPGNQVLLTVKKEVADMPVPVSVQLLSMPKRVGLEDISKSTK